MSSKDQTRRNMPPSDGYLQGHLEQAAPGLDNTNPVPDPAPKMHAEVYQRDPDAQLLTAFNNLRDSVANILGPRGNDPPANQEEVVSAADQAKIGKLLDQPNAKLDFRSAADLAKAGLEPDVIIGVDGKQRLNPNKTTPSADGTVIVALEKDSQAQQQQQQEQSAFDEADAAQKEGVRGLISQWREKHPDEPIPAEWQKILTQAPARPGSGTSSIPTVGAINTNLNTGTLGTGTGSTSDSTGSMTALSSRVNWGSEKNLLSSLSDSDLKTFSTSSGADTFDPKAKTTNLSLTAAGNKNDYCGRVLEFISHGEGGLDSINRNDVGHGASLGILQFQQQVGMMINLMRAFDKKDSTKFHSMMGEENAKNVLDEQWLRGHTLSDDTINRLKKVLQDPEFQKAQVSLARDTVKDYIKFAQNHGFKSEQAIARIAYGINQRGQAGMEHALSKIGGLDGSGGNEKLAIAKLDDKAPLPKGGGREDALLTNFSSNKVADA